MKKKPGSQNDGGAPTSYLQARVRLLTTRSRNGIELIKPVLDVSATVFVVLTDTLVRQPGRVFLYIIENSNAKSVSIPKILDLLSKTTAHRLAIHQYKVGTER